MLQDWAAIATIIGLPFVVGTALAGGVGWFIRRRATLPVSAEFGVAGGDPVDSDGVRWITVWVQNTEGKAYLHDVRCDEYAFGVLFPAKSPEVARIGEIETLPRELRSLSEQELQRKEGVFKPQYLSAVQVELFHVACPPEVTALTLVATMSIGRWGRKRRVTSEWLDVPNPEGPGGVSRFTSWREDVEHRRERLADPC